MADQVLFPVMRALDADNAPVLPGTGGNPRAYFYLSGTAALIDIFDADGAALENPLECDANGIFEPVYAEGDVRVVVVDGTGAALPGYPIDPAPKAPRLGSSASLITVVPQTNLPEADVQSALEFLATSLEGTQSDLGTFAAENVADRTQAQSVWNAGTNTTESLISAAKLKALIDVIRPRYTSAEQTITTAGQITLTHGLGGVPRRVGGRLKCLTAEAGYSIGDQIEVSLVDNSTASNTIVNSVMVTTTQIIIRFSDHTSCFVGANRTTGAAVALTNVNWSLIVTAEG